MEVCLEETAAECSEHSATPSDTCRYSLSQSREYHLKDLHCVCHRGIHLSLSLLFLDPSDLINDQFQSEWIQQISTGFQWFPCSPEPCPTSSVQALSQTQHTMKQHQHKRTRNSASTESTSHNLVEKCVQYGSWLGLEVKLYTEGLQNPCGCG